MKFKTTHNNEIILLEDNIIILEVLQINLLMKNGKKY